MYKIISICLLFVYYGNIFSLNNGISDQSGIFSGNNSLIEKNNSMAEKQENDLLCLLKELVEKISVIIDEKKEHIHDYSHYVDDLESAVKAVKIAKKEQIDHGRSDINILNLAKENIAIILNFGTFLVVVTSAFVMYRFLDKVTGMPSEWYKTVVGYLPGTFFCDLWAYCFGSSKTMILDDVASSYMRVVCKNPEFLRQLEEAYGFVGAVRLVLEDPAVAQRIGCYVQQF